MRKAVFLSTVVIPLLLMVAAFTPLANATSYTWDGVNFVEGIEGQSPIKYPHPDRDYYAISPYVAWSMEGSKLVHNQVDRATSIILIASATAVCSVFGAYVGTQLGGGTTGAVVGAVVGAALGLIITYTSDLFLDEHDCLWWWASSELIEQLTIWAPIIELYSIINPIYARNIVLNLLGEYGYIRVGAVTFLDVINMGIPAPPSPPPSGGGGGGGIHPRSSTLTT